MPRYHVPGEHPRYHLFSPIVFPISLTRIRVLSVWKLMQMWNPRASSYVISSSDTRCYTYIPCSYGIAARDSSRLIFLVRRMWTRMSVLLPIRGYPSFVFFLVYPLSRFFLSLFLSFLLFSSAYKEIYAIRVSTFVNVIESNVVLCYNILQTRGNSLNFRS